MTCGPRWRDTPWAEGSATGVWLRTDRHPLPEPSLVTAVPEPELVAIRATGQRGKMAAGKRRSLELCRAGLGVEVAQVRNA